MNTKTTTLSLLSLVFFMFSIGTLQAQKYKHGHPSVIARFESSPTIDHFHESNTNRHFMLPQKLRDAIKEGRTEEEAIFVPIYSSNFPEEAKVATEFAFSVYSRLLKSDVPIYVSISYIPLEDGVLGGSSPADFYLIQDGPVRSIQTAPLAEKIVGESLNADGEADIEIVISDADIWYFGTDGNVSGRQFDYISVMLHEITHGLGLYSLASVDGSGLGSLGGLSTVANPDELLYFSFDAFAELGDETPIFELDEQSRTLGNALTSNDLFFDAPILREAFGDRVKLYAPSVWNQGSSYAHLDDNTFRGTENSLMTSAIGFGEVLQVPGISKELLFDLGWILTKIVHDPLGDTENSTNPYIVTATIDSDTIYFENTVSLTYSYDEFASSETVQMNPTGSANEFAAEIPTNGTDLTIQYFISVEDATLRTSTSPSSAPEAAVHSFSVGNDTEAPRIIHDPIPFILATATSIDVIAGISDNLDVLPEAEVQYSINGVEQTPLTMTLDLSPRLPFVDQTYSTVFTFEAGDINEGDVLEYRIVATDASQNANTTTAPEDGSFFEVDIVGVSEVADEYTNDFEDASTASDFVGEDFIFDQPAGFDDVALHSPHPYPFGDEIGQTEINMVHQLKIPIRIKESFSEATMVFNEIALIEPGEPNTSFGDEEFWDYVIVEGSSDNGTTWRPLVDGYDCQADRTWESTYRGGVQGNDSNAEGNEGLFRERTINLQSTFAAGDEILIRFRLFSDPFAVGWGWAIDDLRIQVAAELEVPEALPATNVEATQFRANWRGVRGAESYLVDVSEDPNFGSFLTGYEAREIVGTIEFVTNLTEGSTYYYRVRAQAGAMITDYSNVIEVTTGDVATGIEDFVNKNEFQIFPNPTSGEILLDVAFVKQAETVHVSVTDVLGKQIINEAYKPTGLNWQQRVSLSGQSTGMYLVTIEVDGGTFTKKVFLER
ncbi:MAG: T9SS type A sorting domain-containing protein [Bacteroidota bacterium]